MMEGNYFFDDNLQYEFNDWKYCQGDDRRFYPEMLNGIKPAGATQMTKEESGPHEIPEGTYGILLITIYVNLIIIQKQMWEKDIMNQ